MINSLTVSRAIEEAERFLIRARKAREWMTQTKYIEMGGKETAACRRASMDLTRALADLRRYPSQKE